MSPQSIGRYEIDRELGRGGMAVVYLARDPYMEREVAVKVLPRQFTFDPQFRARFQREARVIAALDHPAIVPVYDFGEHDEQPYLVMRYMRGGSLANRLKQQGPMEVAEAARVMKRIGSALDEAHRKGVVHRDLKPDNILFDDRHEAFVSDFGIVKVSEATMQYTGNAVIGTPGYMSPEQARGDAKIDGRSDIYSLGAIVFEMLTGKLPYRSTTPMGVMMKHLTEPVPDVLAARPDLPPATSTVISRAMAKEPGERYQTCEEIASDLVRATSPGIQATVLEPTSTPSEDVSAPTLLDEAIAPSAEPQTPRAAPPPPPQKGRRIPIWAWAAGCVVLLVCGGVAAALGGFGLFSTLSGEVTAIPTAVVDFESAVTPGAEVIGTSAAPPEQESTDTPAAPTSEPVSNLVRYDSDESGISVSYPEDWFAEEELGFVLLASDPEIIDSDDIDSGAVTLLFAADRSEFGDGSPAEMLAEGLEMFEPSEDVEYVDGPTETLINGQEAAVATLHFTDETDGTSIVALAALIVDFDRAVFIMGATPRDSEVEFRPTLQAIIDSVDVREPTVVELPEPAVVGVITYGETVAGTVTDDAGSRWNLVGFEGDVVDIIVQPADDFDVVLLVQDEAGFSILDTDEIDDSFGTEEVEGLSLPYTGDYLITLRGFAGDTGDYELTVLTSEHFTGGAGSKIVSTDVLESGSEHFFPFSADGPATVTMTVESIDEDFDSVVGVYDDGTDELLDEVDLSFSLEELVFDLPGAGNYYFRVSGFDGSSGEYQFTIAGPPEVSFEITYGDAVNARLDEDAEIDYFISGAAGDEITAFADPEGDLDVVLEIYSIDDLLTPLLELDDGFSGEPETLTFALPADGLYVIRVRGFAGEVGGFFLTVN